MVLENGVNIDVDIFVDSGTRCKVATDDRSVYRSNTEVVGQPMINEEEDELR